MGWHPQNFLSETCEQCSAIEAVSPEQKQTRNAKKNIAFRGKTETYALLIFHPLSF